MLGERQSRVTASDRQRLNNGDTNAPWALAIHPWLANSLNGYGDEIDEHNAKCSLTLPARTHVTVDENLIPTGTEPVDGTKYDLREDTDLLAIGAGEHCRDGTVFGMLQIGPCIVERLLGK